MSSSVAQNHISGCWERFTATLETVERMLDRCGCGCGHVFNGEVKRMCKFRVLGKIYSHH